MIGHENAGWVHAVGDGITAVEVGEAVLVYPAYSCGLCVPCRRAQDIHCESVKLSGRGKGGRTPEQVEVNATESGDTTQFIVKVAEEDKGKIIGKQGKVIKALRTLATAVALKKSQKIVVDVE